MNIKHEYCTIFNVNIFFEYCTIFNVNIFLNIAQYLIRILYMLVNVAQYQM